MPGCEGSLRQVRLTGSEAGLITEWEIWACAQQLVKQHGGKAPDAAADHIQALTVAGDAEGVAIWRAIADRVSQLTDFRGSNRPRH